MKITVWNGNPEAEAAFDGYLEKLVAMLCERGHEAVEVRLREKKLRDCSGCWSCWWRTPGECIHTDDGPEVHGALVHTDLVLLASPLKMGFVSSLLRRANERMIPLLLPFIGLFGGECHHQKRYARYPTLGLLVAPEPDTDAEDLEITYGIYRRQALNFHSTLALTRLTTEPVEEVADAIGRVQRVA